MKKMKDAPKTALITMGQSLCSDAPKRLSRSPPCISRLPSFPSFLAFIYPG